MDANINGRCDLNSLLAEDKKYQVDLRSRYITQRRGDMNLKVGTIEKLRMFSVNNNVSCEALLLFAWHMVLNVFARGDQTVVLITDEQHHCSKPDKALGIPSIMDQTEHRMKTCIEAAQCLEPGGWISSHGILNLEEINPGQFDSHLLFSGDAALTARMIHPITANLFPSECGDLELRLSYAKELFSPSTIAGFGDVLQTLINQVTAYPSMPVADLEFVSGRQRQMLELWNLTDGEYDRSARLNHLFERAVLRTPLSTAIVYKERSVSFEQLNIEANRLAHYLRRQLGVESEQVIALFLDKNELMIATVIAIWKSGACYSPIDPMYPDARIGFTLEDTGAKIILANQWHAERIRLASSHLHGITILQLEPTLERLRADSAHPTINPEFDLNSDQLAYITYTSGTTGVPKGIKKRHTNVVNSITDLADRYGVKDDREAIVLFSPYVFEPFARQTLIALLNSQTLVVVDDDEKMDPVTFPALMRRHGVTYLNGTASVLQEYDYTNCPDLKRLVLVGEDLTNTRYQMLRKKFKNVIINEYGFTESAFVTAIKIFETDDRRLNRSLGRPLRNVKCYVLGNNLKRIPIGSIGELFVGGQGVSEGYLNRPELTKERFLANPYQTPDERARGANSIIYRTGDLARLIPESREIEYLGRNDFQIKLRGIRIEPGEIESVLVSYPGVKQSVVVATAAANRNEDRELCSQYLVGYWTGNQSIEESDLLTFLKSKLPRYMVPTRLVFMQRIPVTINGKLDYRALPTVDLIAERIAEHTPRNAREKILRYIWSQLLELPEETIGIDHDLFRLGGNSITCIQMVGSIRQRLDSHLTVEQIFAEKTIERLAALIAQPKGQISNALLSEHVTDESIMPDTIGVTGEIDGIYIANSLQQGFMYNYMKRSQNDDAYTMHYTCKYQSSIDLNHYRAAWHQAQQRYSSLRLHFVAAKEVYQVIGRQQKLDFRFFDFSHLKSSDLQDDAFSKLQHADRVEPYRLGRGPLFRVYLVQLNIRLFYVLFSCHHAILDGWSIPILLDFVHESYILKHKGNSIIDSTDATFHMSQRLNGTLRWQNLPYWRRQVGNIRERCDLRGLIRDHVRYQVDLKSVDYIHAPKEKTLDVSETWKSRLQHTCADQSITLHSVLQFVCHKVLNVYGNGRHSVVGTIVSGRNLPVNDVDTAVGLFINTLPLIVDHEAQRSLSVLEAIRDIQQSTITMNMRSSVDLGRVTPGEMTHELFDCLLVLENYPVLDKEKRRSLHRELAFEMRGASEKLTYPLAIVCAETNGGGVSITLRYASELFEDETIDDVLDVFRSLFEQLPEKMHKPITALEFLGQRQISQFKQWNCSCTSYPQVTLNALFEEIAAVNAGKIAVVYEAERMTYAELNASANRLAQLLRGVVQARPDIVIALLLEKSVAMFVAILAVWKAGMAYTPIDPAFPQDRIKHILEDTAAVAVLVNRSHLAKVHNESSFKPSILTIESALLEAENYSNANLEHITCNTDLAYIYFTSGTTGKPKGVMIEHRGVVNLQCSLRKVLQLRERPDEVLLSFSNYTFDHFVEQLTNALLNGQTLLILNDEMRADKDRLYRYLSEHHVTYISGTPSVISMYDYEQFSRLRRIDCVGEDFSKPTFNKIRQSFSGLIINGYGPTEVSITTHKRLYLAGECRSNKSIGFQIDNSRTYVLNREMKRVPVGAVGELYLGGDGVSRGYLNQPKLTNERFPQNPYWAEEDRNHSGNHRLYKTGDLVRWLSNGEIEYLGRNDSQIKLRGRRVETGEIEAAINSCVSIIQSVVVLQTRHIDGSDVPNEFLVGYFVASKPLKEWDLKVELHNKLPKYFTPNRLVQVSTLPVTISGKLDFEKLPKVQFTGSSTYVAPNNDTERRLCHLWGSLLGIPVPAVSVIEDFFSLGGDSLLSTSLSFAVTKSFDRSITIAHIFKYRTIRALACFISHEAKGAGLINWSLDTSFPMPASLSQERLLYIDQFLGGSSAYNVLKYLHLPITTCSRTLKRALISLITRQEALRTTLIFDPSTKRTIQIVLNPESASKALKLVNVNVETNQELAAIFDSEARYRFNLDRDAPIRFTLARIKLPNALVLAFNIHHTAFDGWSWKILLNDLSTLYQNHLTSKLSPKLPELALSYASYSLWQRQQLTGERGNILRRYWKETLDGYSSIDLPTDFPRPPLFDYDGHDFGIMLSSDIFARIQATAKTLKTSVFSIFTGAYCLLLGTYAKQNEVIIGLPVANRHHLEVENVIGCFVNMVALRVTIDPAMKRCDFVRDVNRRVEEAQLNQDFPFEELVRVMHIEHNPNRHPIFQHIFGSDIISALSEPVVTAEAGWPLREYFPKERIYSSAKFDLSTTVTRRDNNTVINFNWSAALFRESSIAGLAATYERILMQLVEADGSEDRIQTISLVSHDTFDGNIARPLEPQKLSERPLADLFEHHAILQSKSTAIVCGEESLTYEQLHIRSSKMANFLRTAGLCAGQFLGILLAPCIDMVVCILAAWKMGAAYVPIAANAVPVPRVAHFIKDASVQLVISQSQYISTLQAIQHITVISLDDNDVQTQLREASFSFVAESANSSAIAYCIYTSGTTGIPNGVLVPQRGVFCLAKDLHLRYFGKDNGQPNAILMTSSFLFDFSVEQFALSFLSGNKLILLPNGLTADEDFYAYMNRESLTYLSGTPSILSRLDLSKLDNLRMVTSAGEQLHASQYVHMRRGFSGPINNAYGTTETTVYNLVQRFDTNDPFINCLGDPISGHQIYVANANFQLLPPGALGELFISGDGVAAGYLHQPNLTRDRFLPNPFIHINDHASHAIIYKTGDVVRRLSNGTLEFWGRSDHQIKMRGFRIELDEVQTKLASYPGVVSCVVLAKSRQVEVPGHAEFLVGYYTSPDSAIQKDEVEAYLSERLPSALVPLYLVPVPGDLPITITGKLETRLLPNFDMPRTLERKLPRTETEAKLCRIWSTVLNAEVGINDDFFHSGGDSIMSLGVVRDMAEHAGVQVTARDIFVHRTIARILERVSTTEQTLVNAEQHRLIGDLELLPVQRWFFAKALARPNHWNQCFIIHTPRLDVGRLRTAYVDLQFHHDAFRLSFPTENGHLVQQYNAESANADLQELYPSTEHELYEHLSDLQASLDLIKGRVAVAAYIHMQNTSEGTVWLALHHLIIDTVSWRIIARDLQRLYENQALPAKSSSYRQWTSAMAQYDPIPHEDAYWQEISEKCRHQLLPKPVQETTHAFLDFSEAETRLLACSGPGTLNFSTEEILLTAFARTIHVWDGSITAITLEGHGRETQDPALDISNTVGWFTIMYPFILPYCRDLITHLKHTRLAMERIPRKGLGYGALFGYEALPLITFNYLGKIAHETMSSGTWRLESGMQAPWGEARSSRENQADRAILDVTAWFERTNLKIQFASRLKSTDTEKLAQAMKDGIHEVLQLIQRALSSHQQPPPSQMSVSNSENFVPYFQFCERPRHGPSLFLFPPGEGGAESYFQNLISQLNTTRIIAFNNLHLYDPQPGATFEDLAQRYITWLQQVQPHGPYHFLGWSFGGVLSLEICLQLLRMGETVSTLCFIDSYFDVRTVSAAVGLTEEDLVLDPINWRYQPNKADLARIKDFVDRIVLFKAPLMNERACDKGQKKLFAWYQESGFNGLDAWIPPSQIETVVMIEETHFTWVKNPSTIEQIGATVRKVLNYHMLK